MKKKIFLLVTLLVILFGADTALAASKNGITINKDESSNRIDLYCQYINGQYVKVVRDRSDAGDAGEWDISEGLSPGSTCIGGNATNDCLKSLKMIDSEGNLDCPLYIYGQTTAGTTNLSVIQGFTNTTGNDGLTYIRLNPSASICEGVCNIEDQKNDVELNTFTCEYKGQSTGQTLKVEGKGPGNIIITYPDGTTKTTNSVSYTSSCPDLYYVLNSKQLPLLITKSNFEVNPTLSSLCRTYEDTQFDQFCAGDCDKVQLTCPNRLTTEINACDVELPKAIPIFVSNIIKLIKILVPILLIVMGMIDFARAVMASDEKQMKESQSRFIRRILGAIIIFFVVAIVQFIFNLLSGTNDLSNCLNCFVNGKCKVAIVEESVNYEDECKAQGGTWNPVEHHPEGGYCKQD